MLGAALKHLVLSLNKHGAAIDAEQGGGQETVLALCLASQVHFTFAR